MCSELLTLDLFTMLGVLTMNLYILALIFLGIVTSFMFTKIIKFVTRLNYVLCVILLIFIYYAKSLNYEPIHFEIVFRIGVYIYIVFFSFYSCCYYYKYQYL